MASVLPQHENEGEDKHVESKLVPRLDESSNLSSSTFDTQLSRRLYSVGVTPHTFLNARTKLG